MLSFMLMEGTPQAALSCFVCCARVLAMWRATQEDDHVALCWHALRTTVTGQPG